MDCSSQWVCSRSLDPLKKQMCLSWMIWVLCCLAFCTLMYSHEHIAKKIAIVASWAVALFSSELLRVLSLEITDMGMAFWCFSAGSAFFYALNCCCRRKASWWYWSKVGLDYPLLWKVAHRYWRVFLTVLAANLSWECLKNLSSQAAMANDPMSLVCWSLVKCSRI